MDTAVTTGGAITGFVQLLPYWFYEYCGVGHPIVKEEATGEVGIPLDPPLSMSPHISPATLHEMRQAGFVDCEQFMVGEVRETYASYWAEQILEVGHMLADSQRMGNLDLFRPSAFRAGITPVVVTLASVHSFSQDFSLPGEAEGPDLGWHMEGNLPLVCLAHEELWHLTHSPLKGPTTHVFILWRRGAVAPDPWFTATRPCRVCAGRTEDPGGGGRDCYCPQ
ncbi:hypothetical protein GIB67_041294, partial [Kingdonia uniflora]